MNTKQTEITRNWIYSFSKIKSDKSFVFFDFFPFPKMKQEKPINPSLICAAELTLSTRCHLILPPQLQKELKSSRSRGRAEGLAKATRSAGPGAPNLRSQPLLLQF